MEYPVPIMVEGTTIAILYNYKLFRPTNGSWNEITITDVVLHNTIDPNTEQLAQRAYDGYEEAKRNRR